MSLRRWRRSRGALLAVRVAAIRASRPVPRALSTALAAVRTLPLPLAAFPARRVSTAVGAVLVPVLDARVDPAPTLRHARWLSGDVRAVYAECSGAAARRLARAWHACGDDVPLVVLADSLLSPLDPLVAYADSLAAECDALVVLLPAPPRGGWLARLTHAYHCTALRLAFLGRPHVTVLQAPTGRG